MSNTAIFILVAILVIGGIFGWLYMRVGVVRSTGKEPASDRLNLETTNPPVDVLKRVSTIRRSRDRPGVRLRQTLLPQLDQWLRQVGYAREAGWIK